MYRYLVTWEHVSAILHPDAYENDKPLHDREDVPEYYWTEGSHEYKSKVDAEYHYNRLVESISKDSLVRNVALSRGEIKPIKWMQLREHY